LWFVPNSPSGVVGIDLASFEPVLCPHFEIEGAHECFYTADTNVHL
jgi:hypothetical protein